MRHKNGLMNRVCIYMSHLSYCLTYIYLYEGNFFDDVIFFFIKIVIPMVILGETVRHGRKMA